MEYPIRNCECPSESLSVELTTERKRIIAHQRELDRVTRELDKETSSREFWQLISICLVSVFIIAGVLLQSQGGILW